MLINGYNLVVQFNSGCLNTSARLLGLRGGSVNRTFKGSSPSGRGINPHESTSTPAVKIESGTVLGKSILTSVPGLKSTVSPELISNSAGPSLQLNPAQLDCSLASDNPTFMPCTYAGQDYIHHHLKIVLRGYHLLL